MLTESFKRLKNKTHGFCYTVKQSIAQYQPKEIKRIKYVSYIKFHQTLSKDLEDV